MEVVGIESFKNFYDLKQKAILLLIKIERSFDIDSKDIEKFENLLKKLKLIASEQNLVYFEERLKTIHERFDSFLLKRKETKRDLNKIYSLFEKIKEDKKSNLINNKLKDSLINNKLFISKKEKKDKNLKELDSYYVLQFQDNILIVPNIKKKIIKNISYRIKYLSFNKKKIPIFPLSPLMIDTSENAKNVSHILVLKTIQGYRCIRFDEFIQEEHFEDTELEERKIESGSVYEDTKYFIRWRGRNCFFLDFKRISSSDLF
jgi:hypothetical protein